jgi:N-acetylmuramoyl-L-alanine amidase
MDILLPGIRDRRIAASDEYLDGSERTEREQFLATPGWARNRPTRGRFIFGAGTLERRLSEDRPIGFNLPRGHVDRSPSQITTIILHSTAGPEFSADALPARSTDGDRGSYHRVDEIIAHLLVFQDGTIVYTHDIELILSDAGGRKGIDIEFAGSFPNDLAVQASAARLRPTAIQQGRRLVKYLKSLLPHLRYIHPHGQVQRGRSGKLDSCPGPDVWVNVGEWAVEYLGLTSHDPDHGYPNHGISRRQSNPAYRQSL